MFKFNKKVCLFISILFLGLFIFFNVSYSNTEVEYKNRVISRGETLWSISADEQKNNEYFKNEDIRKIIFEIRKINNLSDNELYEGLELKIPTTNS